MEDTTIKVGDRVMIEQAWEDQTGAIHDVIATVTRILPDGCLKFRYGKRLNRKDGVIQAHINKMEWYAKDVQKI